MSLILCPDCGNECSAQAASCPKCGHPFVPQAVPIVDEATVVRPVPHSDVVVRDMPPRSSFPNWLFIPIAVVLGAVVIFFILLMRDNRDEANENVNVRIRETASGNLATNRTTATANTQTVNPPQTADSTLVVPPSAPSTGNVTIPGAPPSSLPQTSETTTQTVTPASTPMDKGNLAVTAQILNRTGGGMQPVRQEKFYLLDKDLESILSDAGVEPEEGDYATTFGAAVSDPSRQATLQKFLAAIKPHIISSVTTDAQGKAQFKNVKPDSYYLFGVTKTNKSFAVWNTSVIVNPGDNSITLNGTNTSAVPNNRSGATF